MRITVDIDAREMSRIQKATGVRKKSPAIVESARRAMLLLWPLITLGAATLIYLLITNHFEVSFVYEVTSRGGMALLPVNESREWLPRAPRVATSGTARNTTAVKCR